MEEFTLKLRGLAHIPCVLKASFDPDITTFLKMEHEHQKNTKTKDPHLSRCKKYPPDKVFGVENIRGFGRG